MDRDDAKMEVGKLLETLKGQTLAPEEVIKMFMQATRDANPIECHSFVGQLLADAVKNGARGGVIDWVKLLDLLKKKLAEQ